MNSEIDQKLHQLRRKYGKILEFWLNKNKNKGRRMYLHLKKATEQRIFQFEH